MSEKESIQSLPVGKISQCLDISSIPLKTHFIAIQLQTPVLRWPKPNPQGVKTSPKEGNFTILHHSS